MITRPSLFLVLLAALLVLPALAIGQVTINEVRIDQTGTDNDEYFELKGTPGTSLNGYTYLVIGDGSGGCGTIENVTDLTGLSIPAGGLFLCAEATFTIGPTPDLITSLNFENSDNVTHLIVTGFTGANGDDLDTDNDGVLDITPWTTIVDRVALIVNPVFDCVGVEAYYSPTTVGPDGTFVPGHAYVCPDSLVWKIGGFAAPTDDTPRAENPGCANPLPSLVDELRDPCVPLVGQSAAVTVTANFADDASITYTVNGGGGGTFPMSNDGTVGSTTTFSYTLPAQITNGDLVEYLVTVSNGTGDVDGFQQGYFVGTVDIADIRVNDGGGFNQYEFYGVRVTGVVTAEYGIFSTTQTDGYIQDATGGIKLFDFAVNTEWATVARGEEITVSGALDQFNGELELTAVGACDTLTIEDIQPGVLPTPIEVTPCTGLSEQYEGMLVRALKVQADTTGSGGLWGSNVNYDILNCTTVDYNPDLRVDADTNIPGTPILATYYDVTGVLGQFDSFAPDSLFNGYQLKPRELTDLTPQGNTVGVGDDGRMPDRLALLQNAPNPFRGTTEIRFNVPASAGATTPVRAKLEVFDVAGRRVAVLLDKDVLPGTNGVTLNERQLEDSPTGVYFYRLTVADEVLTRKLVFQR